MPSYSIIENFEVHKNNRFLEIAEALKPELLHKEIKAEKEARRTGGTHERNEAIRKSRLQRKLWWEKTAR